MANKNKEDKSLIIPKGISNLMNNVQTVMDKIYQSTHMTNKINNSDMELIKNKMNDALTNISKRNLDNTGSSSLSQLFNNTETQKRLTGFGSNADTINDLEDLFGSREFTDNFTVLLDENKSIKNYDEEIDIILKYFPMLKEALETKKDCVLAADNNTKDFLHFNSISADEEEFVNNIKKLKDSYNLTDEFEHIYDQCSKYGECFYYLVPYKKAIAKLLNNKKNNIGYGFANESAFDIKDINENHIIEATFDLEKSDIKVNNKRISFSESFSDYNSTELKDFNNLKVNLNVSGILENVVSEYNDINKAKQKIINNSVFGNNFNEKAKDEFVAPDGFMKTSIVKEKDKTLIKEDDLHINGAIFKELRRENIIPIYVDNICLGYYYIECEFDQFVNSRNLNGNALIGNRKSKSYDMMKEVEKKNKREAMLGKLSKALSDFIDTSFINTHQDIKDQLYMILKYNDDNNGNKLSNMKVSYLSPSDVKHYYFKFDKNTHRGISDLQDALIPAKLYIQIMINTALAILTRSYDKRVYYVKQSVDTNIAASVQNVLNQIKKGNFGAREISSIKNILGFTGRFSDYVIPTSPTGESPINMEVMNGQQIQTQDEYTQSLAEQAIEATDMPYEFVQSRNNTDYATRLTMSNGKVLRKAFKRQSQIEIFGVDTVQTLYFYEFGKQETMEMELPPPTFLTILNTNNLIQNVDQTVESILAMELDDDSDPKLRRIMKKKLMRAHLSTYLDTAMIDRVKEESNNEFHALKKPEE